MKSYNDLQELETDMLKWVTEREKRFMEYAALATSEIKEDAITYQHQLAKHGEGVSWAKMQLPGINNFRTQALSLATSKGEKLAAAKGQIHSVIGWADRYKALVDSLKDRLETFRSLNKSLKEGL